MTHLVTLHDRIRAYLAEHETASGQDLRNAINREAVRRGGRVYHTNEVRRALSAMEAIGQLRRGPQTRPNQIAWLLVP